MNDLSKVMAHGMTGGISSVLQGAKFKSGFMAGGFTQLASVNGAFNSLGDATQMSVRAENAVAAAIVGGTTSVIGGGKFENGAMTGAFSRLFNDCSKNGCWTTSDERASLNPGDFLGFYSSACGGGDLKCV